MDSGAEDEVLRFLIADETAAQLLARTFVQPLHTGLPLIDRFISFRGGQVLEIAAAASAGCTTALLQVAATCMLPEEMGGRGANVLLLDLDSKMDLVRLLETLEARVNQAQLAARQLPDAQPVVVECLSRLHVVRCHGSFDLLAALRTLRPTLDALTTSPAGLACLLIDNIAAYYYLDKSARGAPAAYASSGAVDAGGRYGVADVTRSGAPLTLHRVHTAVAAELRAVQQQYRVPIIATKHLLLSGGSRETDKQDCWSHRETMLKPWQDLVTHRLLLRLDVGGGSSGRSTAVRLAKWHTPDEPAVTRFEIAEAGIHLC